MARRGKRSRESDGRRLLAKNRQARRDYEIEETFEAGIALTGTEVKSCREGKVQLKDAYAQVKHGELWLVNCHISPYEHAGPAANHEPERHRKLLLHKHQIRRLMGKVERSGYTLVPLAVQLDGSWIKVEIALARGRAKHEKRDQLKKKIQEREVEQALRGRR
jgi:SsrA-binding protein